MKAPTGAQHHLTADTQNGKVTVTVTELAARLRAFQVDGVDLVETFDSSPPKGSGLVMVPWPNRIRDGRWRYGDRTLQLPLTEPERHNAIHGLLTAMPYCQVARGADWVALRAEVFPQPGYPFHLETTVTYAIEADGLAVTHLLKNVGGDAAPVALGAHPYLKIGNVPTSSLTLRVAAARHLEFDERLNALGTVPVAGAAVDFRAGRVLGDVEFNVCYCEVEHQRGRTEHSLAAPDGRTVTVWGDESIRYVQVYVLPDFPAVQDGRAVVKQAIAVEPMTAPADAFNSGEGLRWLQPDESWTVKWGIRHEGFSTSSRSPQE